MFTIKNMKMAAATFIGAAAIGTGAMADLGHGASPNIGQTGSIAHIDREIRVEMGEMFFDPRSFDLEVGETIKFIIQNKGRAVHEFAIGTLEMQKDHEGEMRQMQKQGMMTINRLRHDKMRAAGMMHTDPNSRLLEPGETAELIWTFSGDAEGLMIACNVPGHRQAGMKASINFIGQHS